MSRSLTTVPIAVRLVRSSPFYAAQMDASGVAALFADVNAIWTPQTGIAFAVDSLAEVDVDATLLDTVIAGRHRRKLLHKVRRLAKTRRSGAGQWHLLIVNALEPLGKAHARAYPHPRCILLADSVTSVPVARTCAHELGHALGLPHAPGQPLQLMSQGRDGTRLTDSEIDTARQSAQALAARDNQ